VVGLDLGLGLGVLGGERGGELGVVGASRSEFLLRSFGVALGGRRGLVGGEQPGLGGLQLGGLAVVGEFALADQADLELRLQAASDLGLASGGGQRRLRRGVASDEGRERQGEGEQDAGSRRRTASGKGGVDLKPAAAPLSA